MKRLFLFIGFFIAAVIFLLYIMQHENSYFLLVLANTSIEMSVWLAVLIVLSSIFSIWLFVAAVKLLLRRTRFMHQRFFARSEARVQRKFTQGLVAFLSQDWALAHKNLMRSAKHLPDPQLNYLAAAHCAYEIGETENALHLLKQAEKCSDENTLTISLMQARMHIKSQAFESALGILLSLESLHPTHNSILSLLKDVYIALEDWAALKKLLPVLHKEDISTLEERYYLEQRLCQETVKDNVEKNNTLDNAQRVQLLEGCVNNLPKHFQKDTTILTLFINTLVDLKAYDNAGKILARNINREWNEAWVHQYGLLSYTDTAAALTQAETWLKPQPSNSVLQLTLGRLCLQNKQWGRAKDFFLASIAQQSSVAAYAELARLQHALGESKESEQSYKQGLLCATPDLLVTTLPAITQ
ncbi:heme biosynthesis HemY N-terminal domain-containing protein [Eionea flava]